MNRTVYDEDGDPLKLASGLVVTACKGCGELAVMRSLRRTCSPACTALVEEHGDSLRSKIAANTRLELMEKHLSSGDRVIEALQKPPKKLAYSQRDVLTRCRYYRVGYRTVLAVLPKLVEDGRLSVRATGRTLTYRLEDNQDLI